MLLQQEHKYTQVSPKSSGFGHLYFISDHVTALSAEFFGANCDKCDTFATCILATNESLYDFPAYVPMVKGLPGIHVSASTCS